MGHSGHSPSIALKTLLPFGFGGAMLLLVGLASWLGWWGARQITSELVDEKRHAVIELVELQIRAHLHRIQQQVLGIGRLISDGRLRPEDKAAIGETSGRYFGSSSRAVGQPFRLC